MVYSVILKTCGNPDFGQDPLQPLENVPSDKPYTASIEECQDCVRKYIEEYDIGAGNWVGGQVYDGVGEYIGRISYNGKFWPKGSEH